jgi:hypothetical protein
MGSAMAAAASDLRGSVILVPEGIIPTQLWRLMPAIKTSRIERI